VSKKSTEQIFKDLEARVKADKSEINPIYKELAAKVGLGDSEPLQRILSKLANLEQAKIVAALPDPYRKASAEGSLEVSDEFAKKLNMDKKAVDRHIRELFEKGLLFPSKKGPIISRSHLLLHDSSLHNPKYDKQLGREFFDLWAFMDGPMRHPLPQDLQHPLSAFGRIIPRWKSIENVPGVMPCEDIEAILKSQDLIALLPCACKRSHIDRWCDIPNESCITVGRVAHLTLERGIGRKITYKQALEVMEKFNHYPTVNVTLNQREVTQLICNCHYCCCPSLKIVGKSRFIAETDPEKCLACGTCIERCQFGAISMKYYPEFGGDRAYVDSEICRGCGCCVITCPSEAKTMKLVRPPDHIPEGLKVSIL
jgi:electron transport complex protein RnfB